MILIPLVVSLSNHASPPRGALRQAQCERERYVILNSFQDPVRSNTVDQVKRMEVLNQVQDDGDDIQPRSCSALDAEPCPTGNAGAGRAELRIKSGAQWE